MGLSSTSNLKPYQFLQGQRVFFFIKFRRFRVSARSCGHWNQSANGREPKELWRCHPVHPPVWSHLDSSTYDISDGCLSKPILKLNSASRHFLHWPAEVYGSHKEGPKAWQCQEETGGTPVHIQHSTLCRTPRAKQNTWFQLIAESCSASPSTKTRRGFEPEPLQISLWVDERVPTAERATGKSEHRETRSVWKTQSEVLFVITD